MSPDWELHETSTHQDHVIAHVIGTTVLGYFEFDQAAHLVLDIGFIWTIFVDGEMGLVPQTMAISELELDADAKTELRAEVDALHDNGSDAKGLTRVTPAPMGCLITDVSFHAHESNRRLLITGEEASLVINTSLLTGEIHVAPM
ncbi:MAG: hypothetical protein QOH25_2305 [Acidobacteriota bacterium]|jgi:hypothetical protein|nr:hypothetical protein [Acidobacteriota bacterium]